MIMMIVILKLIFILDLRLGVININNAKHLKKIKSRTLMRKQEIGIGACQKMRKKK